MLDTPKMAYIVPYTGSPFISAIAACKILPHRASILAIISWPAVYILVLKSIIQIPPCPQIYLGEYFNSYICNRHRIRESL